MKGERTDCRLGCRRLDGGSLGKEEKRSPRVRWPYSPMQIIRFSTEALRGKSKRASPLRDYDKGKKCHEGGEMKVTKVPETY